jgi:hypothetical protein
MHVAKRPATPNEWVALVSDLHLRDRRRVLRAAPRDLTEGATDY